MRWRLKADCIFETEGVEDGQGDALGGDLQDALDRITENLVAEAADCTVVSDGIKEGYIGLAPLPPETEKPTRA